MVRSFIASLVLCLLAACGGGADDQSNDFVPVGAKLCEIKEVPVSRFQTYSNLEVAWDSGTQAVSTMAGTSGRHQIWFWPGPAWVSIDASAYTLGQGYRSATSPIEGIVPFNGTISLAGDLTYDVTYASVLGYKDGVPLIGTQRVIPRFGAVGATEREPRPDDATGFQVASRFVSLRAPVITVMSGNVLQVNRSFGIGLGPTPEDIKLDLFLLEDCYHCGKNTTWTCQIRDLSPGDVVAITGIPRNQGFRFYANLFATTVLDNGQKAISDSDSVLLSY